MIGLLALAALAIGLSPCLLMLHELRQLEKDIASEMAEHQRRFKDFEAWYREIVVDK